MSPFYTNYGFHLAAMNPTSTEPLNPASQVYAHWIHTVHDESRKWLEDAQERMRWYTDPTRKEPPAYQVGDLVMLNRSNIKNAPSLEKAGPQESWSLSKRENRLPAGRPSHTSPEMEDS